MPFNGVGMFTRVRNWVADAAAGVKIRADYHDIEDDGFADGLSHCITKDGQTTVTQNIPMNSKRIVALQDPVDLQDASTKAYADTKLPLAGGTITGALTVTGKVTSSVGYATRAGVPGPAGGSVFNFNWTGNLEAWVDTTNIGALATQAYVEARGEAWAHYVADPKVNRAGDTMTGGLTVNGELVTATSVLRFQYSGSPGYIWWTGGGSYTLGGGGTIWHNGNLNPIQDGRLAFAGNVTTLLQGMQEPYGGAVVTGLSGGNVQTTQQGLCNGAKYRYMQLLTPGGWYTVGYA